jgi:hypothetical protein
LASTLLFLKFFLEYMYLDKSRIGWSIIFFTWSWSRDGSATHTARNQKFE